MMIKSCFQFKFLNKRALTRYVTMEDLKQLREMTGAPLSECKKALIEAKEDISGAKKILRAKNLTLADKKIGRDSNEGLWGLRFSEDRTRAVLLNLQCETDFVAKSDSFIKFLDSSLDLLLNSNETLDLSKEEEINSWVDQYKTSNGEALIEQKKILIAQTEENINFGRVLINTANQDEVLGGYVHKTLKPDLGTSGCFVSTKVKGKGTRDRQLFNVVDNLSVHIFGRNPAYLYLEDMPKEEYEAQIAGIREEMKNILKGKPENVQENILKGKTGKVFAKSVMEKQTLGFEESEDTIEEYLKNIKKQTGNEIRILGYERF